MNAKQKTIVIAISGRKGVGKDWLASKIWSNIKPSHTAPVVFHFADAIREVMKGYGFNDTHLTEGKDRANPLCKPFGCKTPREVMIDIGMSHRAKYGDDFWANQLVSKIGFRWDKVIVADMRFPIELSKLKEKYAKVIHIHVVSRGPSGFTYHARYDQTGDNITESWNPNPDIFYINNREDSGRNPIDFTELNNLILK